MADPRRSYHEMLQYGTLHDRYEYLALRSDVGTPTFAHERWMNQAFYRSPEWRHVRHVVIARDMGRDLGVEGYEIHERVLIHHMNPMRPEQIEDGDPDILDPEFLISVSHQTHNAIHFGDKRQLVQPVVERRPGDTTLWATR